VPEAKSCTFFLLARNFLFTSSDSIAVGYIFSHKSHPKKKRIGETLHQIFQTKANAMWTRRRHCHSATVTYFTSSSAQLGVKVLQTNRPCIATLRHNWGTMEAPACVVCSDSAYSAVLTLHVIRPSVCPDRPGRKGSVGASRDGPNILSTPYYLRNG